ncbi:MAG: adenylate/guanylate cyclase domain-containing protein [Phycisphaeraceae bacterium]|nr:adenylate/guanylate cyclase domain-containing protein [Phycisphaeraceae bacterium]
MLNHVLLPTSHCVTFPAMQARLNKLLAGRAEGESDREAIDAKIWELYGERWAVMFTDLAGFSRRSDNFGVIHFLQVIYESFRLYLPVIEEHAGMLQKVEGDSMMVLFRRPASALACARSMMAAGVDYNRDRPEEDQLLLSVGLGWGDVLKFGDQDVYGLEVNVACKLGEELGQPGQIQVSHDFHAAVVDESSVTFEAADAAPLGTEHAWRVV